MIAVAIIILVLFVGTVLVAGALRRMVRDEHDVESRLLAPDSHTIAYAVPNGVDAADLRAAVARGGFTSIATTVGNHQCLLVECGESDRERVREVIGNAHEMAYDGTELDLHPVVFEDERRTDGSPGLGTVPA
jgi:hypothetical protein